MKKILHIISSPRGEASLSIKLGNAIIDKIKTEYPGSTVKETDLVTLHFPHLEEAHLTSFFTPVESRTQANIEAASHSDEAIQEIMDADILVIGAPLYNFSIHSSLKAWIRSPRPWTRSSGRARATRPQTVGPGGRRPPHRPADVRRRRWAGDPALVREQGRPLER